MDPQNQQPQVFKPDQPPKSGPDPDPMYALGNNPTYDPNLQPQPPQIPQPEPQLNPKQPEPVQQLVPEPQLVQPLPEPTLQPQPPQIPQPEPQPASEPHSAQQQQETLQYTSGQLEQQQEPDYTQGTSEIPENGSVNWTASEFVAHEKNGAWYAMLIAGAIIIGIIVFIITREWLSLIVIAVLAVAVGVFGNLKPRVLNYAIAPDGITVGEKHFGFSAFTSFAVLQDGAMESLQLLPQKRFMAAITVYLDPAQADTIIETLGEYLPFEHRERDLTDRISSRFRF